MNRTRILLTNDDGYRLFEYGTYDSKTKLFIKIDIADALRFGDLKIDLSDDDTILFHANDKSISWDNHEEFYCESYPAIIVKDSI